MNNATVQSQRYLHDDIIYFQILVKLPVYSLLRFTTVSKSWKACIRSSSFISAHHHHQINSKKSCSHLVYMADPLWNTVGDFTFIPDSVVPPLTQNSLHQLRSDGDVRMILGSCDGLICWRTESIIYIWNPFIRTMIRTPRCEFPVKDTALGFGFVPRSGDLRVVKLMWEGNYVTELEIYSLATDSWRRIKPQSGLEKSFNASLDLFHPSTVSFKGSIYWLGRWKSENHRYLYLILRFDLNKEIFEEIEAPKSNQLVVVNGFLVLLKLESRGNEVIHIKAYIKRESELGSSFWDAKSVHLPKDTKDRVYWQKTTTSGHIILVSRDGRVFAYDCYCDGNDLSFNLRDLGIKIRSCSFDFIPIKETLLLLGKDISEGTLDN